MNRGVLLDGQHLDSQWNLVRSSFNSQECSRKRKSGNNPNFPERHTAFDQSLIPLSAVVKGCVPGRYLALMWKQMCVCVWGFSTAWRTTSRWGGPSCCRARRHRTGLNQPDLHERLLLGHLRKHRRNRMSETCFKCVKQQLKEFIVTLIDPSTRWLGLKRR